MERIVNSTAVPSGRPEHGEISESVSRVATSQSGQSTSAASSNLTASNEHIKSPDDSQNGHKPVLETSLHPDTERITVLNTTHDIPPEADSDAGDEVSPLIESTQPIAEKPRFATKDLLGCFIPELDPVHSRSQTFMVNKSRRAAMFAIQQALAYIVAIANIALMIWAVRTHDLNNGIGTLYIGDCSYVQTFDTFLHLGLNILSTLFLGVGTFCIQILAAPSNTEVRDALMQGVSLDIGVRSFKNLRYISRTRVVLWAAMGFFSITLHLL